MAKTIWRPKMTVERNKLSKVLTDYDWPMANPDFVPFSHQIETAEFALKNHRCFILNDMGCVDCETEFLSEDGWHKISDWQGQNVMQWNKDTKQVSFVQPLNYIKKPCNQFISFDGGKMMLSHEHRVPGVYDAKFDVKSAEEVHNGLKPYLYKSFKGLDRVGFNYSDDEIRVMIAYFADGTFTSSGKVSVRLKLKDKIERMRYLLLKAKITFKESSCTTNNQIIFTFEPIIKAQQFNSEWYNCSINQLKTIADEIWRWDGRISKCIEFSTMRKCSADFIQYVFTSLGHCANILKCSKIYKYKAKNPRTRIDGETTTMYIVNASKIKDKLYRSYTSKVESTGDRFKYCFELPDTFWIMRRNGSITVTGNTGKTLSALWASDWLMKNGYVKSVLIICPLSTMKSVWYDEIRQTFRNRKVVIAHGKNSQHKIQAIRSDANFTIINHDGVKSYRDELIKRKYDIVIIDELTAFKNNSSERWKAAKQICDRVKGVWGMTAEPTPNTPVEAFAQAKLVNEKNPFLPKFITKFREMVEYKITMFVSIPKDDADKTVHQVLQPAIRFKRDQCVDIPECQHIDLNVPMTAAQTKAYEEMRKQMVMEYVGGEITSSNAAVKLVKLLQISSGWIKTEEGGVVELNPETKLNEAYEIFLNSHKNKLVIASAFRASIAGIVRFFESKNVKVSYIHGSVKQEDRAARIADFQHGDLQVLVLQPQAASHGITLTAASTLLWYNLIPSGETYNQMNGRISRIGQTKKQTIIHLVSSKAEAHILKILKNKGVMSRDILELFEE